MVSPIGPLFHNGGEEPSYCPDDEQLDSEEPNPQSRHEGLERNDQDDGERHKRLPRPRCQAGYRQNSCEIDGQGDEEETGKRRRSAGTRHKKIIPTRQGESIHRGDLVQSLCFRTRLRKSMTLPPLPDFVRPFEPITISCLRLANGPKPRLPRQSGNRDISEGRADGQRETIALSSSEPKRGAGESYLSSSSLFSVLPITSRKLPRSISF